jgi:hypothetical protein
MRISRMWLVERQRYRLYVNYARFHGDRERRCATDWERFPRPNSRPGVLASDERIFRHSKPLNCVARNVVIRRAMRR